MNINEFTERTGFRPSEEYYHNTIEPSYMTSPLDKDDFCKKWKKCGGIQQAYDYQIQLNTNKENRIAKLSEEEKELCALLESTSKKLTIALEDLQGLKTEVAEKRKVLSDMAELIASESTRGYILRLKV